MVNCSKRNKSWIIKDHFYGQKGEGGQWLAVENDINWKMTATTVEMV